MPAPGQLAFDPNLTRIDNEIRQWTAEKREKERLDREFHGDALKLFAEMQQKRDSDLAGLRLSIMRQESQLLRMTNKAAAATLRETIESNRRRQAELERAIRDAREPVLQLTLSKPIDDVIKARQREREEYVKKKMAESLAATAAASNPPRHSAGSPPASTSSSPTNAGSGNPGSGSPLHPPAYRPPPQRAPGFAPPIPVTPGSTGGNVGGPGNPSTAAPAAPAGSTPNPYAVPPGLVPGGPRDPSAREPSGAPGATGPSRWRYTSPGAEFIDERDLAGYRLDAPLPPISPGPGNVVGVGGRFYDDRGYLIEFANEAARQAYIRETVAINRAADDSRQRRENYRSNETWASEVIYKQWLQMYRDGTATLADHPGAATGGSAISAGHANVDRWIEFLKKRDARMVKDLGGRTQGVVSDTLSWIRFAEDQRARQAAADKGQSKESFVLHLEGAEKESYEQLRKDLIRLQLPDNPAYKWEDWGKDKYPPKPEAPARPATPDTGGKAARNTAPP